jgi:hypothetical protein
MEPKCTEPTEKKPVELRPDGWERFEQAVDFALKTPAVHKQAKPSVVKDKGKA